jgi:hypothetical protein
LSVQGERLGLGEGFFLDGGELERLLKLEALLMPYASWRRARLKRQNGRVVHYTSAENVFKIIDTKTFWMRNTKCMSDYREVEHGHDLLVRYFNEGRNRKKFCDVVNRCFSGLGEEALGYFDQWWENIRFNTYITSISEHDNKEDAHGRLSMWRAFGAGSARAAIVMNPPAPGSALGLRLMLSPVAYFDYPKVRGQLNKVINNITRNVDFIQSYNRDYVKIQILYMLVAAAVSLKHEGFSEEKEWRVLMQSPLMTASSQTINGIPQIVFQIPLKDSPGQDVVGVQIPSLVDRIIIGPTAYAAPIYATLVAALTRAGITDAAARVVGSGIPIRE